MVIYAKEFLLLLKNCNNKIPVGNNFDKKDILLINNLKNSLPKLIELMNKQNLNEYIKLVVNFSFEANKYFNDSEPWVYKTKNPDKMKSILFTISEQIKNISILLNPIIPNSTKKILDIMNLRDDDLSIDSITKKGIIDHNKELKELNILFKKIEHDN